MDSGTNRSWTAKITRRLLESKRPACILLFFHLHMCALFRLSRPMFWVGSELTKLQLWRMHFASGPCPSSFSVSRCWGYSPTGDLFINNSPLVTSKRTRGTKKREVFVCRRPLQQFEINGNYVYLYVCVCRRCTWIIVVLRCTGVLYETGRYARDAHKFGRQRALRPPIWERE